MKPCLNQATIMQCGTGEFIKVAARAGFEWLELRIPKVEEFLIQHPAKELRELMHSAGVKVATLNALEFFSLVPDENYEMMKKKAEEAAFLCQLLECEWMIAVPSRHNGIFSGDRAIAETTARRLEILSEAVAPYRVKLLFEFIGFPDFSVTDLEAAKRIAALVRGYEIKLVIDTFHFFVGGTRLEDLLQTPGERIGIVHINDFPEMPYHDLTDAMRVLPGGGQADLRAIRRALRKIGFDGWVSLELFNEEMWKLSPAEAASRSWQSLQGYL